MHFKLLVIHQARGTVIRDIPNFKRVKNETRNAVFLKNFEVSAWKFDQILS